jgi:hypothetical protein
MFQGYYQHVKLPAPYKGMNLNIDNNPEFAKYMQNMLVSDNNTCTLRYGTRFVAQVPFNPNRIFRSQIAVMSHLGDNGKSEKIVYQNYVSNLPYVNIQDNVTLDGIIGNPNETRIIIDTTPLDDQQKAYLSRAIFNGTYFYIRQDSFSDGADITNVVIDLPNNSIKFNLPFPYDFFDKDFSVDPFGVNNFALWIERAALYKLNSNDTFNLVPLLENLDPNVIISHINYQGKLLIANGIDPVYVYDGNNIRELKGNVSILLSGNITKNGAVLTFNIPQLFLAEMQTYVVVGTPLTLISQTERRTINVANIAYEAPANNLVAVTLTLTAVPQDNIRTILYEKNLPHFNFLSVANDRLWALAEGRSYKNQFRPVSSAMKVYYALERKSVTGWFNQATNEVDFIDLANNTYIPDNLEAIIPFQGKVLFMGRETTQIWSGDDPTTINDGQNIQLPDFQWEMTVPVGILQKSLFVEIPNDFVFLSKYGIVSVSSINKYQQLAFSYNFSDSINQHLKSQLAFIETERDYLALRSFLYPYGRYFGFKLKYDCFIYQLSANGAWTIFSENFADSRSFYYDPVSQDLFLGMDNGLLLAYADKIQTQSYEEYGKGAMIWRIQYGWMYPDTTWNNEAVFIACRTLAPITINVQAYVDYNDAEYFNENILVDQIGGLYDVARFGFVGYAYREGDFPYEVMRFSGDAFMIMLSGRASDQFIFDKLFLTGGVVNAN